VKILDFFFLFDLSIKIKKKLKISFKKERFTIGLVKLPIVKRSVPPKPKKFSGCIYPEGY
jgi:hypothetical protein